MPTPTKSKTWQHDINNVILSQAEVPFSQDLMYGIKAALIGFASSPWTVLNSTDGSVIGGDRWAGPLNLLWGAPASPHSWIVLQQPGTGGQVCIDLDGFISQPERASIIWSPGGLFVGGSITARPTATDEISANTSPNRYWAGNQTGTVGQNVLNVHHTTDGECTRVAIFRNSFAHAIWRFEAIKQARVAHVNPSIALVNADGWNVDLDLNGALTYAAYTEKDGSGSRVALRGAALGGGSANTLVGVITPGSVIEEWDNEYWAIEEHWYSIEIGHRGPKGSAFDSWLGQYQVHATGDTFPNATTREFYAVGPYLWPWTEDATIPQVA